nr:uncharacterized protein LOC105096732 isoform X1 [Camelus dromedarius]
MRTGLYQRNVSSHPKPGCHAVQLVWALSIGTDLPRTVYSRMPSVQAVTTATVRGPTALPGSWCGHVIASALAAAPMCIAHPRGTREYRTPVRALRTKILSPGKNHSSDPPRPPEALQSLTLPSPPEQSLDKDVPRRQRRTEKHRCHY